MRESNFNTSTNLFTPGLSRQVAALEREVASLAREVETLRGAAPIEVCTTVPATGLIDTTHFYRLYVIVGMASSSHMPI